MEWTTVTLRRPRGRRRTSACSTVRLTALPDRSVGSCADLGWMLFNGRAHHGRPGRGRTRCVVLLAAAAVVRFADERLGSFNVIQTPPSSTTRPTRTTMVSHGLGRHSSHLEVSDTLVGSN